VSACRRDPYDSDGSSSNRRALRPTARTPPRAVVQRGKSRVAPIKPLRPASSRRSATVARLPLGSLNVTALRARLRQVDVRRTVKRSRNCRDAEAAWVFEVRLLAAQPLGSAGRSASS